MAPSEPVRTPARSSELLLRSLVGGVLIAVALGAAWLGGRPFAVLVAVVVLLVFAEWSAMHRIGRPLRLAGMLAVAFASYGVWIGFLWPSLLLLAVAAALVMLRSRMAGWGMLYAGFPAAALISLRAAPNGFALVIWTLALVWATDIFAYAAGRLIGGPRIAPRISPAKTWAGLGGGMLGSAVIAAVLAPVLGLGIDPALAAFAGAGLAVVAQAGDFFESALKRRAGVKDSGILLPGHGGVMDRVDGAVPVAVVVALALRLAA